MMIEPVQILIGEHGRIRRMLSCFETQLELFEQAEMPDYEILEDSIAYCQEYLDRWHHPREDVLLDFLKRRAPRKAEACADLEGQHHHLASTTTELVRIFAAVEHDAMYPRERLVEMGRNLVNGYRGHIEWEEANFFPAVTENLLLEDWQEIAPAYPATTRKMLGFKLRASAQRFLMTHAAIYNAFDYQRHLISRPTLRLVRSRADSAWTKAVA